MSLREIRTVTITEKGQIVIPKNLRKNRKFSEGSKIVILRYDDHLELRPMSHVKERMLPAIASEHVLAKDWLSPEDEKAWKKLQKVK